MNFPAESNPKLGKIVIEAVENQIRNNDPPATKQTYKRLLAEGLPPKECKRLIACALSSEMFEIMTQEKEFDEKRYVGMLNNLPDLPWESDS